MSVRSRGDIAVVGAGIIGLSIAFELAERGAVVRVFDRAEPARAASWAAAGMLAPYTEGIGDAHLSALGAASLQAYPAFVERVSAASGVDPKLRLNGIADVAFDAEGVDALRERARSLCEAGVACEMLDRASTLAREPAIGTRAAGALLVPGEGCVDNRRLGRALVAACRSRGVDVVRVERVGIECDLRRVLGVRTSHGFAPAGAVVNACGAWAGDLEGVPALASPPVVPIKGQMLALTLPQGLVRHTTWVPGAYLVPRDDGRLLVGATVEDAGFDTRVTAAGMRALLDAALSAAPMLGDFTVSETWAGLRPGSSDGRPFIGRTAIEGLFVATGHYRNGILLAPETARLLADAILLDAPDVEAFAPGRLMCVG